MEHDRVFSGFTMCKLLRETTDVGPYKYNFVFTHKLRSHKTKISCLLLPTTEMNIYSLRV